MLRDRGYRVVVPDDGGHQGIGVYFDLAGREAGGHLERGDCCRLLAHESLVEVEQRMTPTR